MEFNIAIAPGDGIGPEVTDVACAVLSAVEKRFGHSMRKTYVHVGGAAIDACGEPLPKQTIMICKDADAVLLGAVGGEKWDRVKGGPRPEEAILGLRKELGLFANLRGAVLYPQLMSACPLNDEIAAKGFDIMIVRELTGGIYFGESGTGGEGEDEYAYDTERYTRKEIKRIAEVAFETARSRKKDLVSVDKANVLASSRLWRRVITEIGENYPDVTLRHMYVDNAAMQLVRDPSQFDVIVTSNIFGDILSDEAAQLTGSIGMLSSASLGAAPMVANVTVGNGQYKRSGLYEPIHGSAPDIAGCDIANPIAAILSMALMLRISLRLDKEAESVETAVLTALSRGYRTKDIAANTTTGIVGTKEIGEVIASIVTEH